MMAGLRWWTTAEELVPSNPIAATAGNIRPENWLASNAFSAQTSLGWEQLLRGRMTKK
jgi:hypothetical protein